MYRKLFLVIAVFLMHFICFCQSWQEAVYLRNAQIDLYWNTSEPFIFRDGNGELKGVEYENILLFKKYLFDRYSIALELNWIEIDTFGELLDTIKGPGPSNRFGISAFSITPERLEVLKMTNSYLSDIVVFVSSKEFPIVATSDEINDVLNHKTAVTIKATIYEEMLYNLRDSLDIDFDISFIKSDESVVGYIGSHENCFGFIDLPIYLNLVKNGRGNSVTRQNLFTQQGTGYGCILPLSSDWKRPFDEFLADPHYKRQLTNIISKYFGKEYLDFLSKHYERELLDTSILTEEKELQLALIENASLKLDKEETVRKILTWSVIAITSFFLIIVVLFVHNNKNIRLLIQKKNQIEKQEISIRKQNDQLATQNEQLVLLNEEKNSIVKILAHDMRAPIGQIIGVADLLNDPNELSHDQKAMLLETVGKGARKMDEMIKRILDVDVLENKKKLASLGSVDVNQAMGEILNRNKGLAERKGISLEVHMLSSNRVIVSDGLLLSLIIENLITNAIKFSKSGTTVKLIAAGSHENVLFKVMDQGPGFTKEDKLLAFNRFQRLSAKPTGGEHSIGLGLSIVKKYVEDLGGEIWLESEQNKGSVFFVRIPDKKVKQKKLKIAV